MRIAVASGKGGTGKTLLATHLAVALAERLSGKISLADADVEAPNCHLFLTPRVDSEVEAERWVPELIDTCDDCAACQRACAFNAIVPLGRDVVVFAELCHACGACLTACPRSALGRKIHAMGRLRKGAVGDVAFVDGLLNVGEARATPLVEAVVEAIEPADVEIIDCPPGTSCAAMAAVHSADHVLLVTEPTPFGLHDLELAAEMVAELGVEGQVILNRADLGDPESVRSWAQARGLSVTAEIPFDERIARASAAGELAEEALAPAVEAIVAALNIGGEP